MADTGGKREAWSRGGSGDGRRRVLGSRDGGVEAWQNRKYSQLSALAARESGDVPLNNRRYRAGALRRTLSRPGRVSSAEKGQRRKVRLST